MTEQWTWNGGGNFSWVENRCLEQCWRKRAEKNSGETNGQATTGVMILP
jgi:hypothetical protein